MSKLGSPCRPRNDPHLLAFSTPLPDVKKANPAQVKAALNALGNKFAPVKKETKSPSTADLNKYQAKQIKNPVDITKVKKRKEQWKKALRKRARMRKRRVHKLRRKRRKHRARKLRQRKKCVSSEVRELLRESKTDTLTALLPSRSTGDSAERTPHAPSSERSRRSRRRSRWTAS